MKNMRSPCGEVLTVAAPYDRLTGEALLLGKIFGVCTFDVTSGDDVTIHTEGVYCLMVKDSSSFAVGDYVYWNNTNKEFTSTSSGNTKVGVATEVALTGDTTMTLKLNGVI